MDVRWIIAVPEASNFHNPLPLAAKHQNSESPDVHNSLSATFGLPPPQKGPE